MCVNKLYISHFLTNAKKIFQFFLLVRYVHKRKKINVCLTHDFYCRIQPTKMSKIGIAWWAVTMRYRNTSNGSWVSFVGNRLFCLCVIIIVFSKLFPSWNRNTAGASTSGRFADISITVVGMGSAGKFIKNYETSTKCVEKLFSSMAIWRER